MFSERLSWKEEGELSGPALRELEHARSRPPFIYCSLTRSCPALSPLTHVEHRLPHGDLENTSENMRKPLAWDLTLAPVQHQQESPVWGAVKKETIQFKQHDPGTARPQSSVALEPLSGATAHTEQRGPRPPASPGPAPLLRFVLVPRDVGCLCSKEHCLDWPEWSCSDWSMKMLMGIQLHSSDWTGKVSVLLVQIQFQEPLYKGWFRGQGQCRQAGQRGLLPEAWLA